MNSNEYKYCKISPCCPLPEDKPRSEGGYIFPGQYRIEDASRLQTAASLVEGVSIAFIEAGMTATGLDNEYIVSEGYRGVRIKYENKKAISDFWRKETELKEQAKQGL